MDGDAREDDGQPLDPNAPVPLFGDGADANNAFHATADNSFPPNQQLGDNSAFPPHHDPQMNVDPPHQAPMDMAPTHDIVKEDVQPVPDVVQPPAEINEPSNPPQIPESTPAPKEEGGFTVDEDAGIGVKTEDVDMGVKTEDAPPATTITTEIGPPDAAAPIAEVAAVVAGVTADGAKPEEDENDRADAEAPPIKSEETEDPTPKKRMSKPVKKVLVAKKESDIAVTFLTGKRDLADTLPETDCWFLANEFWVFTHDQLNYVLDDADTTKGPTREQIISKLEASKDILFPPAPTDVAAESEEPKSGKAAESKLPEATPTEGEKMDIDTTKEEAKAEGEEKEKSSEEGPPQPMDSDEKDASANETADKMHATDAVTPAPIPNDPESIRSAAEAKIDEWKKLLAAAKGKAGRSIEEIFPLDGPIKVLFTPTVRNFLSSVKIKTLLSYMSLKKTETGAICEFFLTWRKKCGLAPVTPLGVAKYLLGVNARIENALAVVPPVEEEKRHWMMDPIIVMTGAAREFLIEDQKILTAFDFVHTRTKDLSLALAAWRERKGFVPLKGSGKVAMISGWKATSKESLELESATGRVLTSDEDLEGLQLSDTPGAPLEFSPPPAKKRQISYTPRGSGKSEDLDVDDEMPLAVARPSRKSASTPRDGSSSSRRASSSRKQSEYDLHSKLFLDEVLGEEETDILGAVGLHTAGELFEADDEWRSHIVNEIREAQLATGADDAEKLIEQWTSQLKEELGITGEYQGQNPVKRKRKFDSAESASKKTRSAAKPKKSNSHPHHKIVNSATVANVSDPYELLSSVTKEFLATIGIETAEKFLATRTTDIAAEFVTFRKKKGMTELKGLGSIASVSGWKANCRKFCRQMNMDDIAELEPPDKVPTKGDARKRIKKEEAADDDEAEDKDGEDLPFSDQKKTFAVQGSRKDSPLQFRFDLSLRSSFDKLSRKQDIFVTYKGSFPRSAQSMVFLQRDFAPVVVNGTVEKMIVLRDALLTRIDRTFDLRAPFSSPKQGCGLVDLSRFGVRNIANQDLTLLKQRVASFVKSSADSVDLDASFCQTDSNMMVRRTGVDSFQYLMIAAKPMQAGQTMPLFFPSISGVLSSKRFWKSVYADRHGIVDAFLLLSKHDIQQVLSFLMDEMLKDIGMEDILNDSGVDMIHKLPFACISRQRLSWLTRHLIHLAGIAKDDEIVDQLYFGVHMEPSQETSLDSDALAAANSAISKEFRAGLLSLLEVDTFCGGNQREGWCAVAREFFDAMIDTVATNCEEDFSISAKSGFIEMYGKVTRMKEDGSRTKWLFKFSPLDCEDEAEKKENVAVCKTEGPIPYKSVVEGDLEGYDIAVGWYKKFLVQVQVKIAHACGFLLKESDFPKAEILDCLKPFVDQEASTLEYGLPGTNVFPHQLPTSPAELYRPQPLQFFLGIVWPVLLEFGWKVKVINYPSETTYIAPQWRGDGQKQGKLAKLAKQQRDRRRSELSRRVNQMGLGTMPKFTKRLIIASKEAGPSTAKPVASVISSFLKSRFDEGSHAFEQAKEIVELVLKCFDEHASSLRDETKEVDGKLPRDSCSISVFMQFLLILPSLLTQSDLPLQEVNDALLVIQDLSVFCSEKATFFFTALPPVECYATEEKLPATQLVERLGRTAKNSQEGEELTEVIWEEDKLVLSDFVVTVMEQVVACRATEEDMQKKARRIGVGYPGAACRHCLGQSGEGRYFFTTIESLTTLGTVFEKHFVKCPSVPNSIKKDITVSKLKHHEQRTQLPSGSQQKYFLQLWDRLRTMRISNNEGAGVPVTQPTCGSSEENDQSGMAEGVVQERKEFTDALDVLDYVRTTVPWKGTKEIDTALNQYYTCVEFGGRIYNTSAMPKYFSPAWLLGKVGPKKRATRKKMLPG